MKCILKSRFSFFYNLTATAFITFDLRHLHVKKVSMKHLGLFSAIVLVFAQLVCADPTASIFVKDASEFKNIQKDLEGLKAGFGQNSAVLDSLWDEAGRIAKMNDQCATISINDVLDEACSYFYAVELPTFETKYMEVTGELRLNSMKMGNTLAERTEQVKACANALGGILVSKEQLLKLNGSVDLEPLNFDGAFDATYNFDLYFDADRMKQQQNMMNRWLDKCGDIILRKSGGEFAPLFIESVKLINDSLKQTSANVRIVVEPDLLDFYLDLNRSVGGAYYLNGVKLFSVSGLPIGRKYTHLFVNLPRRLVTLPMGLDGQMQNFRGRVQFNSVYQEKDLVGRWSWGDHRNATAAVVKGEISETAVEADTSLTAAVQQSRDSAMVGFVADGEKKAAPVAEPEKKSYEDQARDKADSTREVAAQEAAKAAAEKAKNEDSGSRVHIIPLVAAGVVAIGGGVMAAVFNKKAKDEREKTPKSSDDYDTQLDNIESAQTMRSVGLGIAAAGLVAAGVTFLF